MIDVVIPTKSFMAGLQSLLNQLASDPGIDQIIVVADGDQAFHRTQTVQFPDKAIRTQVNLGDGIHVMWNLGMNMVADKGNHVCFINDDVSVGENCMSRMASVLDANPEVGLVTPNPGTTELPDFSEATGFAGYCMMLAKDLCPQFRFDERMKWWYGDNDIIMWVNSVGRKTGFTGLATCAENRSYTITNDPPVNFHQLIEEDARIYKEKWGQ
jgi:hypothetical protein